MKTSLIYLKKHLACFGTALLLAVSVSAAKAQILLTVNIYDPSNVTITATGSGPDLSPGSTVTDTQYDGIDLLQLFTTSTFLNSFGLQAPSTLTTGNGSADGAVYDSAAGDKITSEQTDLSLFNLTSGATESFTQGTDAFTGTITLNLSGYGLESAGYTGNIVTGYYDDGSANDYIGKYNVVSISAPEPSTWGLLIAGLAIGVLRRMRPRRRLSGLKCVRLRS